MRLHRAEGFLYTKHPDERPPRHTVTHDPINDDGEVFGYAYTARPFPRRLTLAEVPKALGLKNVFGYAYTARYEPIPEEQVGDHRVQDDRIERTAA